MLHAMHCNQPHFPSTYFLFVFFFLLFSYGLALLIVGASAGAAVAAAVAVMLHTLLPSAAIVVAMLCCHSVSVKNQPYVK